MGSSGAVNQRYRPTVASTNRAPASHARLCGVGSLMGLTVSHPSQIRYPRDMSDESKTPSGLKETMHATRPWWIVPIVIIFVLALILVFTDVAPLKNFAYTVF